MTSYASCWWFVGFELKPQYAEVAARNLAAAVQAAKQGTLFTAGEACAR